MKPVLHPLKRPERGGALETMFAIELGRCHALRPKSRFFEMDLEHWTRSHVDLINAMHGSASGQRFALRMIARPDPGRLSAGWIDAVLLGVAAGRKAETVEQLANELCRDVIGLLATAVPEYSWEVVTEKARLLELLQPFDLGRAHVAEIRRREECVSLETMRPRPGLGRGRLAEGKLPRDPAKSVYVAKRFVPRHGDMKKLLRALLLHEHPSLYQVTIVPTRLTPEEIAALESQVDLCDEASQEARRADPGMWPSMHGMRARHYSDHLVSQMLRLADAPFLQQISLCSPQPVPETLLETVGVELTEPVASPGHGSGEAPAEHFFGGGFDCSRPAGGPETAVARKVVRDLECAPWGPTLAPGSLARLRFLMDATECAGAFRFPRADLDGLPGLDVSVARRKEMPREFAGRREAKGDVFLGNNFSRGVREPVYLQERDRRQHLYVVGQTGAGKTTLLKTMALSDMEEGRGLAFLDPHGDVFRELLELVPEHRKDDVILLDPADRDYPPGLNLLECADPTQRHFVIRSVRGIMEKLVTDTYSSYAIRYMGPVFFEHVENNLLLVMSRISKPGTLVEFFNIFQSRNFWKKFTPLEWKDPQLEQWVTEVLPSIDYLKQGDDSASLGTYIRSKFGDFVFDPVMRNIFGQRHSTISFGKIMDEKKILLVNLAKGLLTEVNSRFLGMVVVAEIVRACMARVRKAQSEREFFSLYVDEFQSLATANFEILLSEARKFGLSLVLANQFVSQIRNERIMNAVFGNVATTVAFRLGSEDARALAQQFEPFFDEFDLSHLPNWQAAVRTTVDGQVVNPFTLNTALPSAKPSKSGAQEIRKRSRKLYARPRKEVELEIRISLNLITRPEAQMEEDIAFLSERQDQASASEISSEEFFAEITSREPPVSVNLIRDKLSALELKRYIDWLESAVAESPDDPEEHSPLQRQAGENLRRLVCR